MKIKNVGSLLNKVKTCLNTIKEEGVDSGKKIYSSATKKINDIVFDAKIAYNNHTAPKSKLKQLADAVDSANAECSTHSLRLLSLKMFAQKNIDEISRTETKLKIAKLKAQKAQQEYEKFKANQDALQKEFERINGFSK